MCAEISTEQTQYYSNNIQYNIQYYNVTVLYTKNTIQYSAHILFHLDLKPTTSDRTHTDSQSVHAYFAAHGLSSKIGVLGK